MMIVTAETIDKETLDKYIAEAARAAGYEGGFGIEGCDLSLATLWAAYCRQSLEQQSQNNRLPEYLLTMAKMARDEGVMVPREYILYDHETGEHLGRPGMIHLRRDLVHGQQVKGVLFADLRCLSREPAPQQVFERECELLGVKLIFGDAPSGMDVGSQFARSAMTFGSKLTRLATNRNARAGNVGRVLKRMVPAHKAAHGYDYCRDAEIGQDGRTRVKKAWWEVAELDSAGEPVAGSPAWVVQKIFGWIGDEGRSSFWVAKKLNEAGLSSSGGGFWSPAKVCRIVRRRCYVGENVYNHSRMVPNPERPLGDVTGEVRRTISRAKPEDEWVHYAVPPLVTKERWQAANDALTRRGRGRGKQGRALQALLRNRIMCPRCGKPMVVRRDGKDRRIYYHCSRRYRTWDDHACGYRRFVPGSWDDVVWDCVEALLSDDAWIEEQLAIEEGRRASIGKLEKAEESKIAQLEGRISRIQEGYETGIYSVDEAKRRIESYRGAISQAEHELLGLRGNDGIGGGMSGREDVRRQLRLVARDNLIRATFEEKLDVMSRLNISIFPSEDLKTVRLRCGMAFGTTDSPGEDGDGCGIITFAPPDVTLAKPLLSASAVAGFTRFRLQATLRTFKSSDGMI
jgi:DNA invertase Pin-like site-specific DNA recombinase